MTQRTTSNIHRADGRRVETEITTTASPADVWKAWTDPTLLSQWFTDEARGVAEPGETITWIFKEFGVEIPYPVVVADPDQRLVLAGEIPGHGHFALEVTIEKEGGQTVVRLVNSGFLDGAEWDEEYEGTRSGWVNAMALLKHYLEHYFRAPKRAVLVMRPASFEYDEAYRYFTEPDRLARWLTVEGEVGATGTPCHLALQGQHTLSGVVLAATGQEVAVSWPEYQAVLELKAYRAGPNRMLASRITAWNGSDELESTLRAWLTERVERLAAQFA